MNRNILYLFITFCIICATACGGLKAERSVDNNVFFSSADPRVAVKINPELAYIGKYEKKHHSEYTSRDGGTIFDYSAYIFGHVNDNKYLDKGVLIQIYTLQDQHSFWLPDLFEHFKAKLDSGTIKIEGENYQYVFTATYFSKPLQKVIADSGCLTSYCYLAKGLGRRAGTRNETKIYVLYFEDLFYNQDVDNHRRSDWQKNEQLSDKQRAFLKGFTKRADENIQILKDYHR